MIYKLVYFLFICSSLSAQITSERVITICGDCQTFYAQNEEGCCNWFEDLNGNILSHEELLICDASIPFLQYIKSDCVNKKSVEIWAVEIAQEICNDGEDNNCDGLVDCEDTQCQEGLQINTQKSFIDCNCNYIEIVELSEECSCEINLSVLSGSGNNTYSWSNGSEDANIIANQNGSYSVTLTGDSGISCEASYDFEKIKGEFSVEAIGSFTLESVICTNTNNILYGSDCSTGNIRLELLNNYDQPCPEKIQWIFSRNDGVEQTGIGQYMGIFSKYSGLIEIYYCDELVFTIDKRNYSDVVEIDVETLNYNGEYGWDDTTNDLYREAGLYDEFKYEDHLGSVKYSSLMSILNGQKVELKLDFKETLNFEVFSRDPNFFIDVISSDSEQVFAVDAQLTCADLKDNPKVTIGSSCEILGGNADDMFSLEFEDQCGNKLSQIRVASGIAQNINLYLIGVNRFDDFNDEMSGFNTSFSNRSNIQNLINTKGFNQLFRHFTIKPSEDLVITKEDLKEILLLEVSEFNYMLQKYEDENSIKINSEDGSRQDFVFFVSNYNILFSKGYGEPASGDINNIIIGGWGELYFESNWKILIHELGHALHLCHNFIDDQEGEECTSIPRYPTDQKTNTLDFMSYNENAIHFHYHHWINRF